MCRTSNRKTYKRILWTLYDDDDDTNDNKKRKIIKTKPVIYACNHLFSLLFFLVVAQKATTNQYLFANAASIEPKNVLEEPTAVVSDAFHLNVTTIKVLTSEKYLEIRGHGFDTPHLRDISFFVSNETHKCDDSAKPLKILTKSESSILLLLHENFVKSETMYLCYRETFNTPLIHLGPQHKFIRYGKFIFF